MTDREVDGPVLVVLGRSWGLCVRPWAALAAYVGGLGAVLGPLNWEHNCELHKGASFGKGSPQAY